MKLAILAMLGLGIGLLIGHTGSALGYTREQLLAIVFIGFIGGMTAYRFAKRH